ncbi:MAG: LbtU family siderophore porin [Pseudomonadaceae bacterium]
MEYRQLAVAVSAAAVVALLPLESHALTLEELAARVELLDQENQRLKARLAELETNQAETQAQTQALADAQPAPAAPAAAQQTAQASGIAVPSVRVDHQHAYRMLDPTTRINRKQEYLLRARQNGDIDTNSVYLSGAVTAIADYQRSNTESKFGYLMRHPTANNQRTHEVSEAIIHSAQLSLTATLGDWTNAYMELLYDPQQSFGSGTTTDLNRNQVQVRQGYVLFGNLDRSPFYLSLGKMATPFGLTDTLNPFTASTVWHGFGGLAYGANLGLIYEGWNLDLMAVQGGSQFRAANTPVDDSNVPSRLNNYAADLNYTFDLGTDRSLLMGASYLKGSPYCQGFPVVHFNPCEDTNPAWDVYAQLTYENWTLQAEYAATLDEWPGTFNPTIPEYEASKVNSWNLGSRTEQQLFGRPYDLSLDFSRYKAGPSGSPWEKQDQWVLGLATFLTPSTKLFGELIRTEGYVPLNFISGGNVGPGATHSDADAHSDVIVVGANVAF